MERKHVGKDKSIYVYVFANGEKIILRAGENGVSKEDIALLYRHDADEDNNDHREAYKTEMHFENHSKDQHASKMDYVCTLGDEKANPLAILIEAVNKQESAKVRDTLLDAIKRLTRMQQQTLHKIVNLKMSNAAVAREEGVSEAAIHYRVQVIRKKLRKVLEK